MWGEEGGLTIYNRTNAKNERKKSIKKEQKTITITFIPFPF
jgi:hypothetical protein